VAAYHEAKLAELVAHVAGEIDRFRDGDLGPFDMDRVLFQYSRAAKELWKYCSLGQRRGDGTLHTRRPGDRLVGARSLPGAVTRASFRRG
jgi:hypothetical protein